LITGRCERRLKLKLAFSLKINRYKQRVLTAAAAASRERGGSYSFLPPLILK
jgi:hypothetical protein